MGIKWKARPGVGGQLHQYEFAIQGSSSTRIVDTAVDIQGPTVTITNVPTTTDGSTPFTVTFTFSEAVSDFDDVGDVTATNASVDPISASSSTVYTAVITPDGGGGGVTVSVTADAAQDLAGNKNIAVISNTATLDADNPTVTITNVPATTDGAAFTATFTFSEEVTGFTGADITATNADVGPVNGTLAPVYTAEITPTGGGDITLDVAAGVAADLAGNMNLAAVQVQVVVKSTVIEDTAKVISAFTENRALMVVQNQPGIGRRLGRLKGNDTNSGGISGFGLSVQNGAIPFAAQLSEQDGSFSYSLRKSRAKGTATKYNANVMALLGHAGLKMTPDDKRFEATAERTTRQAAQRYTNDRLTLEAPRAHPFLIVTSKRQGCALKQRVRAEQRFHETIKCSSDHQIADAQLKNDEITDETINYALGAEPQIGTLNSQSSSTSSVASSDETPERFDIWVEGKYSRYSVYGVNGVNGSNSGNGIFAIAHIGMDYLLMPDLLVGVAAQFDWVTYESKKTATTAGSKAEGFGFMAGPYLTARLSDNFYSDVRLAWGQSRNSVSPYDTYQDTFNSKRWLASAALIGDFNLGAVNIKPELRLSWFREETGAYTDTLSNSIPSIITQTGTLAFGPTFSINIELDNGLVITPRFTTQGIWTFANENSARKSTPYPQNFTDDGLRASIEAGFDIANDNGLIVGLSGSYDGIGDDSFETWSGKISIKYRW